MRGGRWIDVILVFAAWMFPASVLCVVSFPFAVEAYGHMAGGIVLFPLAIGLAGGIANAAIVGFVRPNDLSSFQRVMAVTSIGTLLTLAWMVPFAACGSESGWRVLVTDVFPVIAVFYVPPLILISTLMDRVFFAKAYLELVKARSRP